jgi:hypothetical protein
MVDAWREEWGADLPFGFVELAGFQRQDPPELMSKRIVALERMQQQIASNQSGVFYAVAMDLSDEGVKADLNVTTNVHSRFKEQVAERLSLGGRAVAFEEKKIPWQGPLVTGVALSGCGSSGTRVPRTDRGCVRVTFEHVGPTGLWLQRPDLFELGYDNSTSAAVYYRNATAVSLPAHDAILVKPLKGGSGADSPIAVRYAMYNEPCNPVNDHAGMSPGGGGATMKTSKPTLGNETAVPSCSLYSNHKGSNGRLLLPARSFWLNVTSSVVAKEEGPRVDCSPSFPSGPPSDCAWTTSCTAGRPFWNTPYRGTSCTWQFTPADIGKLFINTTFRTAYAVNISIYDGASDAAPRLAIFDGAAMDPKADDGYLHAQGSGRALTVRLDADPEGGTFGLMFGFNITGVPRPAGGRAHRVLQLKSDDDVSPDAARARLVRLTIALLLVLGVMVIGGFYLLSNLEGGNALESHQQ